MSKMILNFVNANVQYLMLIIHKILKLRIVIYIFLIIFLHSCRKDVDDNAIIVNYEIELDKKFRLLKITQDNPPDVFITSYDYYDKEIKVVSTYNGTVEFSENYLLNDRGLADSCILISNIPNANSVTYYKYNNDGYMIYSSAGLLSYNYLDGNRISAIDGSYGQASNVGNFYEYSSSLNYIDIEEFRGFYLGNLNKNLIARVSYRGLHAGDGESTDYQYKINADGLVVQRTALTTYTNDPNADQKIISNFKYKFVE
jgi:hypothetical protein